MANESGQSRCVVSVHPGHDGPQQRVEYMDSIPAKHRASSATWITSYCPQAGRDWGRTAWGRNGRSQTEINLKYHSTHFSAIYIYTSASSIPSLKIHLLNWRFYLGTSWQSDSIGLGQTTNAGNCTCRPTGCGGGWGYVLCPLLIEARVKVLSRFRGAESGQQSILRYNCFVSIADAEWLIIYNGTFWIMNTDKNSAKAIENEV